MTLRTVTAAISVSVLAAAGAAQGTLFPGQYWYQAVDAPKGSALADVNGDGWLDCLVANAFTDKVSVYLGSSIGLFTPQPPLAVGGTPYSVALTDLNGDSFLDLVTANAPEDDVAVLLGDGQGGFGAPTQFPSGGYFPAAIDSGDVDGDGDMDIVTVDGTSDGLSVLLGNGTGSLAPALIEPLGHYPERIELVDVNADGILDCVAAAWLSERVVVALGDGAGHFNVSASRFAPDPKGLAVGDVTGDGLPDVITASAQDDVVSLYRGLPGGALSQPKTFWLQSTNNYATTAMLADVSGDGRPDLIVACATSKSLIVFANVGGTTYFEFALKSTIPESPYDGVAADLNGDGFADVVTSNLTEDSIRAHMCAGLGSWEHYCTAKVNSLGCTPRLYASGTPSVSNPRPFRIVAVDVLDNKQGMFIYRVNGAHASTPFHGGTLCLTSPGIKRTPVQNSMMDPKVPPPNCTGSYAMDFNAFARGLAGGNPDPALLVVGTSYQVQVWSRDPGFPPPHDIGLTAAVDVTPWQ